MHHSSNSITFEVSAPKFRESSCLQLQEQGEVYVTKDHLVVQGYDGQALWFKREGIKYEEEKRD